MATPEDKEGKQAKESTDKDDFGKDFADFRAKVAKEFNAARSDFGKDFEGFRAKAKADNVEANDSIGAVRREVNAYNAARQGQVVEAQVAEMPTTGGYTPEYDAAIHGRNQAQVASSMPMTGATPVVKSADGSERVGAAPNAGISPAVRAWLEKNGHVK